MDIASNHRLAALLIENAVEYAIFTMDDKGVVTSWSPGAEKILGYAVDEIVGKNFSMLFTVSDLAAGSPPQELAMALENGRAEDTRWHVRKSGERFWANGMTMRIADSQPPALLKILRDETPAKLAEEQRILLLNELNHRIKNTLTIIQSITEQTLRSANVDPVARATLTERLMALSQAHNVLTDENWAGADLETILRQALGAHLGPNKARVRLDGPAVRLSPHQAVAMALALHELATNALKYGSLSNDAAW
ncbi:sensor histidine kinase [Caulobacter endophyticus]|uniref:histidine kinase n=1 Tax=Caulobacter endophyticus TaxID=2172652 RepID=A0A2T9K9Y1_9CAUL|nr:HWE histidine kinase domain-containing protein [Caulobacter endophyticus]PVM92775.1 regulator [Caulobacter endophyticus]